MLSILGAVSGLGRIYFNEVIEDLATGDILTAFGVVIDSPDDFPVTEDLMFSARRWA